MKRKRKVWGWKPFFGLPGILAPDRTKVKPPPVPKRSRDPISDSYSTAIVHNQYEPNDRKFKCWLVHETNEDGTTNYKRLVPCDCNWTSQWHYKVKPVDLPSDA